MSSYQCEDCLPGEGQCHREGCDYCCNCGLEIKAFEDPTPVPLLLELPAPPCNTAGSGTVPDGTPPALDEPTIAAPVDTPPLPIVGPLPNDIPGVVSQIFGMEQDEMPEEWFRGMRDDTFTYLGALTNERWQKLGYKVMLEYASQPPVEPLPEWTTVTQVNFNGNNTAEYGRTNFGKPSGFVKNDSGKNRFSLMPAEARAEVAKAFTYGAQKYPPHNFRKGTEWSRYVDALYRHMNAWETREDKDPESGLNHLAHASACLMILLTLQLTNKGTDDRP